MVPLQSQIESRVESFQHVRQVFEEKGFVVGGNWEYNRGLFDHALDEAQKVWLRIPFQVRDGKFDPDAAGTDATVQFGTPFVLKHVYNEGLDQEADTGVFSGMTNQFQEPLDRDDAVESHWIEKAQSVLEQLEDYFLQG